MLSSKNMTKLLFAFLIVPSFAFADTITNVKAEPSTDGSQLYITWNPLSSDTMNQVDGYAIQWSDIQSHIHIQKYARLFPEANNMIVRLGSFERNTN